MKKIKLIVLIIVAIVLKIDNISADNIYEEYEVGDKITYKNMEFYVIENSDKTRDYVTLLKAEPLTVFEVNLYGTDENRINHVNRYTESSVGTAYNYNGYGGVAYYSSPDCSLVDNFLKTEGCTTDYNHSDIKHIIDNWSSSMINSVDLKEDKLGYKARLLTYDELINNLGYEINIYCTNHCYYKGSLDNVFKFLYNNNYSSWTMTANNDSNSAVWWIGQNGGTDYKYVYDILSVVRPVINLKKNPVSPKKKLTDKEFKMGDMITYNEMDFYVIEDSDKDKNYVTLLKAEPLTYDELAKYGVLDFGTLGNGYFGTPYYERFSEECVDSKNKYSVKCCSAWDTADCKSDYELSDIKKVVDAWASDKINEIDLVEDSTGYKARLLTKTELLDNFNFVERELYNRISYISSSLTPYFVVNDKYQYWIMNPVITDKELTMGVSESGIAVLNGPGGVFNNAGAVRPVVNLKKVSSDYKEKIKIDEKNNEDSKETISVPDTFLEKSVIVVIIGLLFIVVGITISYILIKKKKFTKNE